MGVDMNNTKVSDDVKNSDPYKMGQAIGDMAIAQTNNNAAVSMNVQFVKESGLLNNNYSAIGGDNESF
jgi:hypothetical protein